MLGLFAKMGVNFSQSDRDACKHLVYRFVELSRIARKQGLLALDVEIERDNNFFLATAVGMVVDGVDPQTIRDILQAMIQSGKHSGSALLSRLLIAEGTISLQQSDHPRIIALRLSAMLGEQYVEQIGNELFSLRDSKATLHKFLESVNTKKALPDSENFEYVFLQLDDRTIQQVLRGVHEPVLLEALRGCGYTLIWKMLQNVSINTNYWIAENWDASHASRKEPILHCQDEILRRALIMEEKGEIIGVSRLLRELDEED